MAPLDGFSLFRFIKSSPNLLRSLQPISNAYANAAGHRKVGLKYDDLIIEEDGKVQKVSTPAGVVPCAVAQRRWHRVRRRRAQQVAPATRRRHGQEGEPDGTVAGPRVQHSAARATTSARAHRPALPQLLRAPRVVQARWSLRSDLQRLVAVREGLAMQGRDATRAARPRVGLASP
jgi:hypothetical protein